MTYQGKFTDEEVARATAFGKEREPFHVKRRDESPEEMRVNIMIGKLGELAFNNCLWHMGRRGVELDEIFHHGGPDEYDFRTGLGETVDIKTASKPYHSSILVPHDQFENNPKDWYVGVRIVRDIWEFEVMGQCTRVQVKEAGIDPRAEEFTAYGVYLKDLHPIERLAPRFPRARQ